MKLNAVILLYMSLCLSITIAQDIPSPKAEFGFEMGADRKLIDWDQIVSYFEMLNEKSDRLQLVELGKTTLDRRMIMAIITSPENMGKLQRFKEIQQQLGYPYELAETAAEALIEEGRMVCLITMNIHSNEIAASQESVELAHQLATANDPKLLNILDNTILLIVPSLNPDGQDMITKWYRGTVGSKYEGSRMPQKYHFYADHDNNRDWFFFNLQESRNLAKVLYHEWLPQVVMDQHQMGSNRARFFLPPYADPVNPNVVPSLSANVNLFGKYMIADMHDQGFRGLVTGTIFNGYFEGTMSKTPLWHNRIGILTEAASVNYATPIYFPKTSLSGMGIDLPEYKQQTNFLDPWPGGWWRLRDIVEYQKAAALSMLDLASVQRKKFLRNFYRLNREAIVGKWAGHPTAYIFPANQADPANCRELLRRLQQTNVAIYTADADFKIGNREFQKGDYVIPLAQPARAYIKDLLEVQHYPDLKEYPGGPPRQPYDVTAWTLPMQMGVECTAINVELPVKMTPTDVPSEAMELSNSAGNQFALDRRNSNNYKLVNKLLEAGFDVHTLKEPTVDLAAGTFLINAAGSRLKQLSEHANFLETAPAALLSEQTIAKSSTAPIKAARIGIYQPWIANAYDEGWTRLVLDNFDFEYTILHNDDFKTKGQLSKKFDVLIFGSQRADQIVNGRNQSNATIGAPETKPEFKGGISKVGVQEVKKFMLEGGTVLFFGRACNFAIDQFKLPARNILRDLNRRDYFIPGSILRMQLKRDSPLNYGMPESAYVYMNRNVAFRLRPYHDEIRETGVFGENNLLQSGWAVGEKHLYGAVGLAEIPVGKGKAILYAFRPQHRGQMYGTFKLIFNALYK